MTSNPIDYLSDEDVLRMIDAYYDGHGDLTSNPELAVMMRAAWAARPQTVRAVDELGFIGELPFTDKNAARYSEEKVHYAVVARGRELLAAKDGSYG